MAPMMGKLSSHKERVPRNNSLTEALSQIKSAYQKVQVNSQTYNSIHLAFLHAHPFVLNTQGKLVKDHFPSNSNPLAPIG
jgi:hypothetical protein